MTHTLTFESEDFEAIEELKGFAQKLGITAKEDYYVYLGNIRFEAPKNEAAKAYIEHRKKHPPVRVPNDIDINDIIDEVNNNDYMFEDGN